MSNWWGNKIGGGGQRPPPRSYEPRPPPSGYQPPAPFGSQPQPPAPPPEPQTYEPPDPGDPNGHHKGIWNWQGNPRGGAGETAALGSCPSCGSPRFFSRTNTGGVMNSNTGQTVYPSPECSDCGYPNQQGVLAGTAQSVGAPAAARQGEAPAPTGSLASLRQ